MERNNQPTGKVVLPLLHASFTRFEKGDYEDIFAGFEEIHALTTSMDLTELETILPFFTSGDVIIGSPSRVRPGMAELLSEEEYLVTQINGREKLKNYLAAGRFRFFLTKDTHGKVYLLRSRSGRTRVLVHTMDFTLTAWQPPQVDNYLYMDEPAAYQYYLAYYEALREKDADEMSPHSRPVQSDGTYMERLPLFLSLHKNQAPLAIPNQPDERELDYAARLRENTRKWDEILQAAGIREGRDQRVILKPEDLGQLKEAMQERFSREEGQLIRQPAFWFDYTRGEVNFDGKAWNLHPAKKEILQDISLLQEYMQGTDLFSGNQQELREIYWKVLLYMFVSPFFARLRYYYRKYTAANSVGRAFPMYLILRGPKNGGKSSIVQTGQQLMFGRVLPVLPQSVLSPKQFEAYKFHVKGCPVLIDDVNNSRFRYFKDIAKNESTLLQGHVLDHGCFLLTTNEAEKILPEVAKRTVIFQIDNQLTEDQAAKTDIALQDLRQKMGNALYREYLRWLIPEVNELLDLMKEDTLSEKKAMPDIFRVASRVFISLLKDLGAARPEGLRVFSWADFMGENVKAGKAIRILEETYALLPEAFRVHKRRDQLIVDFKRADLKASEVRSLTNELPVSCECRLAGSTLRLKWSALKQYTKVDFLPQKGLMARINKWIRRE